MQVNKVLPVSSHLAEQFVILCERNSREIHSQEFSVFRAIGIGVKDCIDILISS